MTRTKIAIAAIALMLASPAVAEDKGSPLLGTWQMSSLQFTGADGATVEVPYSGQLIFSDAGTLSVQAMDADPNAAPTTYTLNAYEAYYGPVAIDDAAGTFTITVESSLVRDLIGQDLTRVWKVTGDELEIGPVNPEETWRVTYDRR